MNTHWTETSVSKFRYRITSDFLEQLIKKMKSSSPPISQAQLAKRLKVSAGRVSQILNGEMNNFELESIINYARALEMKVSIVAYEDGDPHNKRGPVDSEIFELCWERQGKPVDFFELEESAKEVEINESVAPPMPPNQTIAPQLKVSAQHNTKSSNVLNFTDRKPKTETIEKSVSVENSATGAPLLKKTGS